MIRFKTALLCFLKVEVLPPYRKLGTELIGYERVVLKNDLIVDSSLGL